MRVFFHVDYKPKTAGVEGGRKVGKDDMSTLTAQLDVLSERIRDISREIEHARTQEIDMKQAGGMYCTHSADHFAFSWCIIILLTLYIFSLLLLPHRGHHLERAVVQHHVDRNFAGYESVADYLLENLLCLQKAVVNVSASFCYTLLYE